LAGTGPSAGPAPLALAGHPADSFAVLGLRPPRSGPRRTALAPLRDRPETLAFYESPRRLAASLADLAAVLGGDREAAVTLELTKRFERLRRGTLAGLAAEFAATETRGEAVIVVAGGGAPVPDAQIWQPALAAAMRTQPLRAAVDAVAEEFGVKRKEVYDAALAFKKEG